MISFEHQGREHALGPGEHFALPREAGFRDTSSADLQSLVAEIDAGRPWREAVAARYQDSKNWLYRIVTDECRTAFFDTVLSAGSGPALDIGSGWGQIARPLARLRPVTALEPVAERMAFIRASARQEGCDARMNFVETDYFDVSFRTRFEAICAIGVLEWAGAFQGTLDSQARQQAFLRKAHEELAAEGSLILGIENRLGLKYLLGCPDDHTGVPGVSCLPAPLARERWQERTGGRLQCFTYSMPELARMLHEAGFSAVEFHAAFPDYKLPAKIMPLNDGGAAVNAWLARETPPADHNGYDGSALDASLLHSLALRYKSLAEAGAAHHFVPSFFVAARK